MALVLEGPGPEEQETGHSRVEEPETSLNTGKKPEIIRRTVKEPETSLSTGKELETRRCRVVLLQITAFLMADVILIAWLGNLAGGTGSAFIYFQF